jgi:hypothetical protein
VTVQATASAVLAGLFFTAVAPSADAPSFNASRATVVYGRAVVLSGTFTPRRAGQPVVLSLRKYGETRFGTVAVLTTEAAGAWHTTAKPTVQSAYRATSGVERSRVLTVGVRPRVTLSARGGAFLARVVSARSYAGRFVLLQRQTKSGWKAVQRLALRRRPHRVHVRLPRGRSLVRIFLPRSQAGGGYLPAASRPLSISR